MVFVFDASPYNSFGSALDKVHGSFAIAMPFGNGRGNGGGFIQNEKEVTFILIVIEITVFDMFEDWNNVYANENTF